MKRTPLKRKIPLKRNWNPSRIRAKPEWIDGIFFPSKGEAETYRILQRLDAGGAIQELAVHPKVVLLAGDKAQNLPELHWSPDFTYIDDRGVRVWSDAKDRPTTEREDIIFILWRHYGPGPLHLTRIRNGRLCTIRTISGKVEHFA